MPQVALFILKADPLSHRLGERLELTISKVRRAVNRPLVRWIGILIALPTFLVGLVLAWRESGFEINQFRPQPMILIILLVPITVLSSTWQLLTIAKSLGQNLSLLFALRVTSFSILSGLFPISSGTVVRAGAVAFQGISLRRVGMAFAFDACVWLTLGLTYSAAALFLEGARNLAGGMTIAALVMAGLSVLMAGNFKRSQIPALCVARLSGLVAGVAILFLSFQVLGFRTSFLEVSALAAAGPISGVLFFFPAGLGVREVTTAAIGSAVGLNIGVTFLAAALARLFSLSTVFAFEVSSALARYASRSR